MESFLPSEIARLVLGYLEDHKCEEAYDIFLKTSPHLEECMKMREEGRKFRTQVLGLNLLDILYEYSAIYSLVQERLKKLEPETAKSLKSSGSLLDKITFLLNATSSGQTMLFSITLPPGRSPSTAHVRKRLRSTAVGEKKKDFRKHPRTEDFSPIIEHNENIATSAFETTSLSSLPGTENVCSDHPNDSEIVRTPKRKSNPLNSSRRSRANSEAPENQEENLNLTALTKAFLDNHELHEKIAENINKVIMTPELSAGTSVATIQDLCGAQNLTSADNTIVSNNFTLELDNAIKKIVQDTESDPIFENFLQEVVCPEDEISEDGEDVGISETSTPCQSTPETVVKLPLKQRLRSAKKRTDPTSDATTPTKIDHQNAVAIESIISMQKNVKESEPSTSGVQKILSSKEEEIQNQESQPKIITNSTTENAKVSKTVSQPIPPIAPVIITEPVNFSQPQDRLVILSSKMTSSGSVFTVQPAQFQTTTTNFSDDILNMPTVIINDNYPSNSLIIPQKMFPTVSSTVATKSKHPLILPHPVITIPAQAMNDQPVLPTTVSNVPIVVESNTAGRSVPLIQINSDKKENVEQKEVTPEKTDKNTQLSLSSGRSHIRALDFSTPPKKSSASPKSPRQTRSNIFSSPLNIPIATRSPYEKLKGNWDESELIFEPSKTTRKTRSSDSINSDKTKNQKSVNKVSDKPLVIDESKNNKASIKTETKILSKSKYSSWDQDLRALIASEPAIVKTKTPAKRTYRKRSKLVEQKMEAIKEVGNKTEEDGKAIEAALAKENPPNEKVEETKKVPAKPARRCTKRSKSKNVQKTELVVREEIAEVKKEETIKDNSSEDTTQQNTEMTEARNMRPRVHKKCNVSSGTKKSPLNPDEKKSPTDEAKPSPSQTDTDKKLDKPEAKASGSIEISNEPPVVTTSENKIASNVVKLPESVMKVKRNLIPMLETPLKEDSQLLPITPRILTPFGSDASFSNLIKQNCGSVDFSSLMTPNFPMTPSFPITPNVLGGDTGSSYASRPTDYSNSSSYYQPSDSEQTTKIDQVLIEEVMKIESSSLKKQWTSTSEKEGSVLQNQELSIPPRDSMKGTVSDEIQKNNISQKSEEAVESSVSSTSSAESSISKETIQIEKDSNTTVIHITSLTQRRGGKHMGMLEKLMKPDDIDSGSEGSESPESVQNKNISMKISDSLFTENCEKEKESASLLTEKCDRETEVKSNNKSKETVQKPEEQSRKHETDVASKKSSNVKKVHCSLLEKLEMKRQRIIEQLKLEDSKAKPKSKVEPKTKMRRKVETTTRVTRSRNTTRKIEEKEKQDNKPTGAKEKPKSAIKRHASIEDVAARLKKDKNQTDDTKEEKTLLFSPTTSNESFDKSFTKEKLLASVIEEEEVRLYMSPDEEAHLSSNKEEDIVKGLKERGIHLIPNPKTPLPDEDNPNIINNEALNLGVCEDNKSTDQSMDTEENTPDDKKENKIQIQSDVYLDGSTKIDVSKILSQNRKISKDSPEFDIKFDKEENIISDDPVILMKKKETTVFNQTEKKEQEVDSNENLEKTKPEKPKDIKPTTAIVPVNEIDEELFHVKIITEDSPEHIKIVHDETKKILKTMDDYDFSVLEKKVNAKVFIEELNLEKDCVLSVTPYTDLAVFTEKIARVVLSPLEVLYNDIVDDSSRDTAFSDASSIKSKKTANIQTRSSTTEQKTKLKTKPQQETRISSKSDSPKVTRKISLEQYKIKQKKEKKQPDENRILMAEDSDKKLEFTPEDDDLMTFALTGNDANAKKEASIGDSSSKKRKAEPVTPITNEKRIKPSDKKSDITHLDLDRFLSRLYRPKSKKT